MFAIVVTLLSLYRCAGSFKQFIGVHVQKAYCKFSTYLWAFSKGTGQPDAYMRSLARAFAQRCKYFKRVCETVLMFGVPVQTVKDLQTLPDVCFPLKMSPTNNEPFCEIFVLFSCVYQLLAQTNLRICADLQEHFLLAHSVLVTCAHTCTHFNMQTQLSSRPQF